ncbi:MAG: hypothetical protein PHW76_03780 [Alphaproteobacteria bacterium]|nr:hypothetical protein [Alphaproteobacteria bacterium]
MPNNAEENQTQKFINTAAKPIEKFAVALLGPRDPRREAALADKEYMEFASFVRLWAKTVIVLFSPNLPIVDSFEREPIGEYPSGDAQQGYPREVASVNFNELLDVRNTEDFPKNAMEKGWREDWARSAVSLSLEPVRERYPDATARVQKLIIAPERPINFETPEERNRRERNTALVQGILNGKIKPEEVIENPFAPVCTEFEELPVSDFGTKIWDTEELKVCRRDGPYLDVAKIMRMWYRAQILDKNPEDPRFLKETIKPHYGEAYREAVAQYNRLIDNRKTLSEEEREKIIAAVGAGCLEALDGIKSTSPLTADNLSSTILEETVFRPVKPSFATVKDQAHP